MFNRPHRPAADQYGDDLGQDFGDQGLSQGQDQNQDQDEGQRRSSWEQLEEPFNLAGQPQQNLTRDQFQSLSGLGNESSQTMNPRDRPRKLHQDMQGDTAIDPYDVGDVGGNRGSRTQEEVEQELLHTASPE